MSSFEVLVRRVDDVRDHPNADRLSILRVLGFEAITAKDQDGNHRFKVGDPVVYVPEAAIVPEHLLKQYGFWNEEKNIGMLSGRKGDRVKSVKLRQIFSQGLVWPVETTVGEAGVTVDYIRNGDNDILSVGLGDDVADFFGITKYEPPVPVGMGGEVTAAYAFAFDYDIENYQNFPGFLDGDEVEAVEKSHGTHCRISYRHGVHVDDLFGEGDVAIASKGLGKKGLVFRNNETNLTNLYVRMAVKNDLINKVRQIGLEAGQNVDLFGEVYGQGVQWLHYGLKEPKFAAFDIALGGKFLNGDEKAELFIRMGIDRLPVLYRGPWDMDALVAVRDGKTTISGDNIREGVVITSTGDQSKRDIAGTRLRPILKMVSPAYLLKSTGDEFQ